MLQEPLDPIDGEIGKFQRFDPSGSLFGSKPKQEHDRVAVAANGVLAHAALRRQMVLEEAHDRSAEIADDAAAHDPAPITPAKCASKRLLASVAISSVRRR